MEESTRSRSFTSSGDEKEDFRSIVHHKFANYVTYIDSLLGHMAQRFEPWPEWLILCDNSFNFLNDLDTFDRKLSFEKLLDMPYSVKSLDSNERTCLITEYLTFLFNAREVVEELNGGTIKQVWYKLLTIVYYFKTCKFINHYALQLLTRSFNGALWKPRCRRLKEFKLVIGHSKMKTQKNLISS